MFARFTSRTDFEVILVAFTLAFVAFLALLTFLSSSFSCSILLSVYRLGSYLDRSGR